MDEAKPLKCAWQWVWSTHHTMHFNNVHTRMLYLSLADAAFQCCTQKRVSKTHLFLATQFERKT